MWLDCAHSDNGSSSTSRSLTLITSSKSHLPYMINIFTVYGTFGGHYSANYYCKWRNWDSNRAKSTDMVTEALWYWRKGRHIDELSIRVQKWTHTSMANWFLTKEQNGRRIVFLNKRCWNNWTSLGKKNEYWPKPLILYNN